MDRIRTHLSYANIMATLAVLLAMSGGALAATGGFSSGGKLRACVNDEGHLKLLGAGKSCKRGLKTVSWNQDGPTGATGATGAAGAPGAAGSNGKNGVNANEKVVVRTTIRTIADNSSEGVTVQCLSGERAISGGLHANLLSVVTEQSYPINEANEAAAEGETPTGWGFAVRNAAGAEADLTAYAECAS